jgi:GTPase
LNDHTPPEWVSSGRYSTNYGQINVAGTFVNNGTIINGIGDTKLKSATEALNRLAEQLAAKLPDVGDKEAVANKTQAIIREAAAKKPDADLLKVTGKGLIEAARTVAEMAKPIATAVGAVLGILGIVL